MDVLFSILKGFGVNDSFFIMLGMFLGTFLVVYMLAIRKLSFVVTERDSRTAGREEEVAHIKTEHEKATESVRAGIFQARSEANIRFAALQAKALESQRQIIMSARDQAASELKTVRTQVSQNVQGELTKINQEIPQLARKIVEQLTGGVGGVN